MARHSLLFNRLWNHTAQTFDNSDRSVLGVHGGQAQAFASAQGQGQFFRARQTNTSARDGKQRPRFTLTLVSNLLYRDEPNMQIERGKPANSGLHGLDRAAERGVEQREEPASMPGSEVLYCHSAGEPSKMERRSGRINE
jgi:hypothetical protein